MSSTILINGRPVFLPQHQPAPARKFCKFCRAVNRRELATTSCTHIHQGRPCAAGICQQHARELGPEQVVCPLHDPDRGVTQECQ